MPVRILVVDNYDSFVFNIVSYLAQLGAEVDVLRNDEVDIDAALAYDGILISPGPGTPQDAASACNSSALPRARFPCSGCALGIRP